MADSTPQQEGLDLADLVENVNDLIQSVRPDGSFLFVNRAWCRTLGYTREEAARLTVFEVIHPSCRNHCQEVFQRLLNGEAVDNFEVTLVTKDGRAVTVEASVNCHFQDGKPLATRGIFRDITERKRAEEALRQSEARLAADLDAMTRLQAVGALFVYEEDLSAVLDQVVATAIAITRADMGNMQRFDASSGCLKIVAQRGFARPFLDFWNTVHEGEGTCGTALKHGQRILVEDVASSPIYLGKPSLEVMAQAGVRAVQSTILQSRSGKLLGIISTHYKTPCRPDERTFPLLDLLARQTAEILERADAEQSLRTSEERLRMSLDNARHGLWDWDIRSGQAYVDDRWYEIFGYAPDERLASYELWEQSIHTDDKPRVLAKLQQYLASSAALYDDEYRARTRDGAWIWLNTRGRVHQRAADGSPVRMMGTIHDVTERKRAEEERRHLEAQMQHAQKLESLGVLAGGIAHDFNNLLTSILGYSDLAQSALPVGSTPWSFLDEVVKGARRAAELTQQMLAYSGKCRFVLQPVCLSALVEDMGRLLEISISKKCVVQYHFLPHLPTCEADAAQMRQIIMNLIINASEAIGDRSGVIAVSTGVMHCDRAYLSDCYLDDKLPEGLYVYLEVADTGCGMSEETKAKLFDPFFTTKFTGRGLGLAALLGIVRGHRGAIKVYSELGKGTTFKVLLPAAAGLAPAAPVASPAELAWRGQGVVLIVDDEETVRGLARQMMEMMGFTVLTAVDGRQGVEVFRARHGQIRLVLLDMTMPHLDGEQAFREMRRIRTGVPTILCSGYNEQTAVSRFAGKGLSAFLQKPFQLQQLAAVVRKALAEAIELT